MTQACRRYVHNMQKKNKDAVVKTSVILVYSSWTMKYALVSFANLLTLAVGMTIGVVLAPHFEKQVQAVSADPQSSPSTSTTTTAAASGPEQISPTMTAGSIGAYLLLAHHVQSDELVVNGVDILKLEQGEINLLSKVPGVYPWQIQSVISDAQNTHLYQVAAPTPPAAAKPPSK
jgi:hypothetical protein